MRKKKTKRHFFVMALMIILLISIVLIKGKDENVYCKIEKKDRMLKVNCTDENIKRVIDDSGIGDFLRGVQEQNITKGYFEYIQKINSYCWYEKSECNFLYSLLNITKTLAQNYIVNSTIKIGTDGEIINGYLRCGVGEENFCDVGNLVDKKLPADLKVKNVEIFILDEGSVIRSISEFGEFEEIRSYVKKPDPHVIVNGFKCVVYKEGKVSGGFAFECVFKNQKPKRTGRSSTCFPSLAGRIFDWIIALFGGMTGATVDLFNENDCVIVETKIELDKAKLGEVAVKFESDKTYVNAKTDAESNINSEEKNVKIATTPKGIIVQGYNVAMKILKEKNIKEVLG
jgi:hypothetical protein